MVKINNISVNKPCIQQNFISKNTTMNSVSNPVVKQSFAPVSVENLQAYVPSFAKISKKSTPTVKEQMRTVKSKLDRASIQKLNQLEKKGILADKNSNDGSTVLDNLYKIATEPRIIGLSDSQILAETIKALNDPTTITQKFGDIPNEVADAISQETGTPFPEHARNVVSSSCVVTSIEFNMASRTPAEFTRFVQGLSGADYSVDKNVKMSSISDGIASSLFMLREFNTEHTISKNWEDVNVKIKPDRNAIVRARVQSSYKDPNERSCVDVLIQSALLNLGSQHTYDALTDERTGKFNNDKNGLTEFEKNFVEEIVFDKPKISVVYQNLDENGILVGYNAQPEETKQHILKSLELGQNVIIGYTQFDENKRVLGGHEITIVGYEQDAQGNGIFICNDTDDELNQLIKMPEAELIPLIHHAGISKDALSKDDVVVEPWREVLSQFQQFIRTPNNNQV